MNRKLWYQFCFTERCLKKIVLFFTYIVESAFNRLSELFCFFVYSSKVNLSVNLNMVPGTMLRLKLCFILPLFHLFFHFNKVWINIVFQNLFSLNFIIEDPRQSNLIGFLQTRVSLNTFTTSSAKSLKLWSRTGYNDGIHWFTFQENSKFEL